MKIKQLSHDNSLLVEQVNAANNNDIPFLSSKNQNDYLKESLEMNREFNNISTQLQQKEKAYKELELKTKQYENLLTNHGIDFNEAFNNSMNLNTSTYYKPLPSSTPLATPQKRSVDGELKTGSSPKKSKQTPLKQESSCETQ